MLGKIYRSLMEGFLRPLGGGLGERLRYRYYRRRFRRCGSNVKIGINVTMTGLDSISIGNDVWIDDNCVLHAGMPPSFEGREVLRRDNADYGECDGALRVGSNIHIGPGVVINAYGGGIAIGDYCGISSGARLYSMSNHYRSYENPSQIIYQGPMAKGQPVVLTVCPIVLGRNAFVTINAIVLGGTIGENSFVTPGSVVAGHHPENAILSGAPAKYRGPRFPDANDDG